MTQRLPLTRFNFIPVLPHLEPPLSVCVSRLKKRPPRRFRIHVTGNTMAAKSVLRNWAKRRMRDAIYAEAKSRGWDRDGRWMGRAVREGSYKRLGVVEESVMTEEVEEEEEQGKEGRDLTGFLSVFTLRPILQATGEEVRGEARYQVGKVVDKMRIGKQG